MKRENEEEQDEWISLVARICAERWSQASAGCRGEWLTKTEARLREANAQSCAPTAALWLAARAWALAAPDGGLESSVLRQESAAQRLELFAETGDICAAGTICASLLGDGKVTTSDTACAWKAEFGVFRALFIEVSLSTPRLFYWLCVPHQNAGHCHTPGRGLKNDRTVAISRETCI